MGAFNSKDRASPETSSPPNPNPTPSIPMSDSPSQPQTESQPPTKKPQLDPKPSEEEEAAVKPDEAAQLEIGEEEEETGECGFCLFMKGGGCKENFVAWENCIEEAEKNKEDIAQKCFDLTSSLRTCMLAHPDYYEPILRAEKAAEEEAIKELDKEKAAEKEQEKDKQEEVVIELENEKKIPAASSEEEKQ